MQSKRIIRNLLIAIALLYTCIPLVAMQTSIDENKLDHIALTQGYGYKYANLRELKTLGASIRNEAYIIAVPIFVGIPSGNIQQFLKDFATVDLASIWNNLINHYFPTPEIQKQTLQTKQYPDGFLQACEVLEQAVKEKFNEIVQQLPPIFNFNNTFKVQDQDIDTFVQAVAQKKERLMVRSTGKEDTKKLANAGGNESVSNVEPNAKEILFAMRDVVASYFGKKSLIQRLGAGDESLFEFTPFTPVLIQRMIGEQHQQQLPKCGVMFTEEPEGGVSMLEIKNSDGSTKTTGITVIQASYGHNEGVVNSLIPVDTFYVNLANHIYPIIRPKTYRMSPAAARKLELKKNEGPLVTNPALNADAILVLKKFADLLEKHYQGPMDVEFVVNEQEKTIYLVQARPIVHNPNLPKPSYIINPDAIPQNQKVVGSAIGVAGGALRWCTGKNSVVVANTIGQALTMYQKPDVQSAAVTCIIVGEMAPATSHEATTFRSEGKPVIYIKELNIIERWLQNPAITLVVSPQQGLIIKWQGKENSVGELITSQIATYGWVSYPVPPFMSVSKNFAPHALLTNTTIITLLPKTVDANQFMQSLAEKKIITPWKQYLHKLKTGTPNEVSIVLATLLYEIHDTIIRKSQDVSLDEDTQQRIRLLQSYLLSCAYQIQANARYTQTDPDYTRRLLPIHFLETLLYQQPTPTEIVDGYSVTTLIAKELAVEQAIIQELLTQNITPDALTVQYLKIGQAAMTPELELQWKQFVLNFVKQANKPTQDAFAHLILNLGKLNMLPIWLHTSFAQTYNPKLPTPEVAQKLVKEYVQEDAFLNQLFEKKAIINALNIDAFGDPKKLASQWHTFNTDLLNYFLSDTEFIASFKQANNFGKLAALNIMTKFVNTFDLSIKAVTGRPKNNVNEIITHFKTMLDGYAALFKKWVTLVPAGTIQYHHLSPLSAYIECIENVLNKKTFSEKDLQTTSNFNVSAFIIGSNTNLHYDMQKPTVLEDIFTMIHQNLLSILSVLNVTSGMKNITLPPLLEKTKEKLITSMKQISLIGTEFSQGSIALIYNYPLREHSMQIELRSQKKSPNIQITLKFFGANVASRWDKTAHFSRIITIIGLLTVDKIHLLRDGLTLELLINEQSNVDKLCEIINAIADFTMTPGDPTFFEKILQKHIWSKSELTETISTLEKEFGLQSIFQDSLLNKLFLNNVQIIPKEILRICERMLLSESTISAYAEFNLKLLIKALINLEYKPEEIQSILEKAIESSNEDIRELGKELLEELYQHFLNDPNISDAARTKLLEKLNEIKGTS